MPEHQARVRRQLRRGHRRVCRARARRAASQATRPSAADGVRRAGAGASSVPGASVCDAGCGPGHVGGVPCGPRARGHRHRPLAGDGRRGREPCTPDMTFEVGTMTALEAADGRWQGLIAFYSIIHLTSERRSARRCASSTGRLLTAACSWSPSTSGEQGDATVHADEMLGVRGRHGLPLLRPRMARRRRSLRPASSVEARLVRAPYPDVEVQTTRAYLLARRIGETAPRTPRGAWKLDFRASGFHTIRLTWTRHRG